ncbi:related to Endoglucanase 1 precursor [Ustilago trichophora]|uniref:cellulase n=1 Tax=Ustilago trichophora TaxID=86804 RepID=A0A5C3EQ18_9BASI|nr:related to Endoglucanase 1 precursor [Ustilago trichophora]
MAFRSAPILIFTLAAISLASLSSAEYHAPTGPFATRFWDCCRAAFSYDHPEAHLYAPVDTCQKDGITLIPKDAQMSGKNGCDDGGDQFACSCIQPWVDTVDTQLGYAFGAYNIQGEGSIESACYLVEFKPQDSAGKTLKVNKLIVQNINTSLHLPTGSWDLNLAGGGVGEFPKGCVNQWGTAWGNQNGGVDNEQACCSLPEGLRSSCLFRFVSFGNNPELASTPKRVRCPVGIIDRSGSQRQDDASVKPYTGHTDKTGYPAEDKYQRQRAICQNPDPMGIVSSICGGNGGSRLPKRAGMMRQDAPGGNVPEEQGKPEGNGATGGGQGSGTAPTTSADQAGDGSAATKPGDQTPADTTQGGGIGGSTVKAAPNKPAGQPFGQPPTGQQSPAMAWPFIQMPGSMPASQMPPQQQGSPGGYGPSPQPGPGGVAGDSSSPAPPSDLAGHHRGVCKHKHKKAH